MNEQSLQKFLFVNNGRWCDIIARVPRRSIKQNSFYWLYLTIISRETGNEVEDLHGLFKRQFLPIVSGMVRFKKKDGTVMQHSYKKLKSTTELSKSEFTEYMDKICAMTEVPIPDPEAAGFISNRNPIKKMV